MMERDEIKERIAIGKAYMQRNDISKEFTVAAAKRVEQLEQQLREIEAKERAVFDQPDDRVQKSIQTIREILKPKPKERRL